MQRFILPVLLLLPGFVLAADDKPVELEWKEIRAAHNQKGDAKKKAFQPLVEKYDGKRVRIVGYVSLRPIEVDPGKDWSWRVTDELKPKFGTGYSFPVHTSTIDPKMKDARKKKIKVTVEGKLQLYDTGSSFVSEAKLIEVSDEGDR